jgi:DNA-binding ferritin-like protein (Dps family)
MIDPDTIKIEKKDDHFVITFITKCGDKAAFASQAYGDLVRQALETWCWEQMEQDKEPWMTIMRREIDKQIVRHLDACHQVKPREDNLNTWQGILELTEKAGKQLGEDISEEVGKQILEFKKDFFKLLADDMQNHLRDHHSNPAPPNLPTTFPGSAPYYPSWTHVPMIGWWCAVCQTWVNSYSIHVHIPGETKT